MASRKTIFLLLSLLNVCMADAQGDSIVYELPSVDVVAENDGVSAVPVQRMDREKMLQLGVHTLSDALRHFSGITLRDYGGAGGMKTVSVRGIGARHTAVVYDGIALSDCQTGEIDLSRYSLDQLDGLSLVIGDGDNIFQPARNQAAAATLVMETGASNLVSRSSLLTPHSSLLTPRSSLLVNMGSFGLISPSIRLQQPIGKRFSLSASGSFFHADNDYPFTLKNISLTTRERRTNSRMNAGRGELNLHWNIDSKNDFSAKFYYDNNHRRLPGIVHYYTNENHERLCEQTAFGQMRLRSFFSEKWALQVNAKYNWAYSDYQNRTPGSGLGDARYWQREAYASAALLYAPTRWLSLDYSLDVMENSLNSTLSMYASHPHRTTVLQSVAAKAEFPRLTLVARGLHSIAKEKNRDNSSMNPQKSSIDAKNSSFDPSLSLSYRLFPQKEVYLRLMAKRIFRLPTFNELYFYHIGSANLRPERASQLNLGITWKSDKQGDSRRWNASATADFYANRVTDKIVAVPFNMFVWRIANLDRATIFGTDITAQATFALNAAQKLTFNGNYSLQRAMNSTVKASPSYHNQLPYTPLHTFAATIAWENPWANIAATMSGQSERWTTVDHAAGTRIDGFSVTDLSLWRTFQSKYTLRFTLQNLFDRQYDFVAHYPMPGRSWRAQFSIKI